MTLYYICYRGKRYGAPMKIGEANAKLDRMSQMFVGLELVAVTASLDDSIETHHVSHHPHFDGTEQRDEQQSFSAGVESCDRRSGDV